MGWVYQELHLLWTWYLGDNIGIPVLVLASEALSDCTKFCALSLHSFLNNRLLKSREKFRQPHLQFFRLSRDESLVSWDESFVSRDKILALKTPSLDSNKFNVVQVIKDKSIKNGKKHFKLWDIEGFSILQHYCQSTVYMYLQACFLISTWLCSQPIKNVYSLANAWVIKKPKN